MKRGFRSLDRIDQLSIPLFVGTMVAEHIMLRRKVTLGRPPESMRPADFHPETGYSNGSAPVNDPAVPDPLAPLGYERKDTTASLLMLVGNVVFLFATQGLLGRLDSFFFKRRVSNIGLRRGSLLLAMVLWDFLYYWDHRFAHRVRLFWANHVNHHSSQRYNLSTALRQPWSGVIMSWIFAPMPLLGFPIRKTFRAAQLNLLYQYWIHTEVVDRLPKKVEAVLNTASHHRVHHGSDKQYLDKNYGGILIVWDKLFGTFEPEVRRVHYGLTKNINTFNPFRIAYHEFASIGRDVRSCKRWRDRLGYIFGPPGWVGSDRSRPRDAVESGALR